MSSPKTASKTPSTIISPGIKKGGTLDALQPPYNPVNSWEFKVTGRGTSGWMSWVKEGKVWVPLRASETSFVSAVAAIEPEIMRLAFPHRALKRRSA